jgi:hypothetical protein
MPENALEMQEYLESYVPGLVGKFLEEKPVPGMEDTVFTLQVTMEGEKTFTFGITIKNAREITVHPGGLEDPMLSVRLPEEVIRHLTRQAAHFTGRQQYDGVNEAKGTLTMELAMPGNWVLPVAMTFNGAAEPRATLRGSAEVMSRVVAGQTTGPEAFMRGDLKFEGDMVFLMSLVKLL